MTQLHERPLKYEATHPVSAKPSAKKKSPQKARLKSASAPTMNAIQEQTVEETLSSEEETVSQTSYSKPQNHPPSAPAATPNPGIPENFDANSESNFSQHSEEGEEDTVPSAPAMEEYSSESEEEPPEDHIGSQLRVRVGSATTKPKSVTKFVADMKVMEEMEKDFKKSAAQLQKRLGIAEVGMIK